MDNLKKELQNIVKKLGYEFYQMVFENREGDDILSIEIDHEKGIDIDDCVKVSEVISDYLDEVDPIPGPYSLEVTSAGAERELRNAEEIKRALGKAVYVETFDQTLEGTLIDLDDNTILIREKNNKSHRILIPDITYIRRAIEF